MVDQKKQAQAEAASSMAGRAEPPPIAKGLGAHPLADDRRFRWQPWLYTALAALAVLVGALLLPNERSMAPEPPSEELEQVASLSPDPSPPLPSPAPAPAASRDTPPPKPAEQPPPPKAVLNVSQSWVRGQMREGHLVVGYRRETFALLDNQLRDLRFTAWNRPFPGFEARVQAEGTCYAVFLKRDIDASRTLAIWLQRWGFLPSPRTCQVQDNSGVSTPCEVFEARLPADKQITFTVPAGVDWLILAAGDVHDLVVNTADADVAAPGEAATLEVLRPAFRSLPLQPGASLTGYLPDRFAAPPGPIKDLVFTCWQERPSIVVVRPLSSGLCYAIFPDQDTEDVRALCRRLTELSFQKTPVTCQTVDEAGRATACVVWAARVNPGQSLAVYARGTPWLALAARRIVPSGSLQSGPSSDVAGNRTGGPAEEAVATVEASPPAKKIAVPNPQKQQEILRQVQEVFESDLGTAADRLRVAKELLSRSQGMTENADELYVMLRRAAQLAAGGGDLESALTAVDDIGRRFDDDVLGLRIEAVRLAGGKTAEPKKPEQKKTILDAAVPVIREAVAAGRIPEAEELHAGLSAWTHGLRSTDPELNPWKALQSQIAAGRKLFERFQTSKETLKSSPGDPEANLFVGQYQCFVTQSWEEGWPHLVKGGNPPLKDLAEQELARPSSPEAQLKLADAWFEQARQAAGPKKSGMMKRAGHWYAVCRPSLTGLSALKADQRLQEIGKDQADSGTSAAKSSAAPGSATEKRRARIFAACDISYQMCINGQEVLSGRRSPARETTREVTSGDVITVRAENQAGSYGFACVILIDPPETKRKKPSPPLSYVTGTAPWQSYIPTGAEWSRPESIGARSAWFHGSGNTPASSVAKLSQVPCQAIWGNATGLTSYLTLQIDFKDKRR